MSVSNFIPELWSGALLSHLNKSHVVANLVNRNYEGEIKGYGNKVKITQLTDVNVKSYTPNTDGITPDRLTTTQLWLDIDKQQYFSFYLDDVDAAQVRNSGGLMDSAMKSAAYKLADLIEIDILKEMVSPAGSKGTLDGTVSKVTPGAEIDASNVFGKILEMKTKMDKNNVPTAGRHLIVTPELHAHLINSNKMTGTGGAMSEAVTRNGYVGEVLGFSVYMSNNLGEVGVQKEAIAFTSDAVTYAEQISEIEAYRPEKRFADAVKGLTVYGVRTIQPKCIVCLEKHPSPEAP